MISAMKKMIELISVVILLAACQPTPTPSPTPTPVQVTASPVATVTPPAGMVEAQVVNVVDGDTIDVIIQGREFRLRYIGVDTPESVHPTIGEEPYGKEAAQRNRELVMGRTVYLEKDVSETDRFGRLLRYVWLDSQRMVNAILVSEGYAQVVTFPPDVKYQELFLALQREAREAGRGLWSLQSSATSTPGTPRYDPTGPDRDCGDFDTWQEALAFFEAAGGPDQDPHRLDPDNDGVPCESLPGAP